MVCCWEAPSLTPQLRSERATLPPTPCSAVHSCCNAADRAVAGGGAWCRPAGHAGAQASVALVARLQPHLRHSLHSAAGNGAHHASGRSSWRTTHAHMRVHTSAPPLPSSQQFMGPYAQGEPDDACLPQAQQLLTHTHTCTRTHTHIHIHAHTHPIAQNPFLPIANPLSPGGALMPVPRAFSAASFSAHRQENRRARWASSGHAAHQVFGK